jgi:hypothetical protein
MMQSIDNLNPALVAAYDELLYLRTLLLHNPVSELLIALYFLASFFAVVLFFFYWCYCVAQLLQCPGEELTDAELDSLRPERGAISLFLQLFLPKAILLQ